MACTDRAARQARTPRLAGLARIAGVAGLAVLPLAAAAEGSDTWGSGSSACTAIDSDAARLACYDRAVGRRGQATTAQPVPAAPAQAVPAAIAQAVPATDDPSPLSTIWELRPADKTGTFRLLPHKLNYLLPVRASSQVNRRPASPGPGPTLGVDLPLDDIEAKFQFSFKVKAWENLFGDNGDLWLAYTQQSNWQLYNGGLSSPFRETNYEPEAILSLRTDATLLGWRWRLLNLGFVHQSNGRPEPLSRSWNRVYAQFGLERGNFTLLLRPWLRLPEHAETDDNPDIRRYLGSGDVRLAWGRGGHVLSALGRYSGSGKRGGLQLDWAFPITGALKGYVQLSSGYGESLIDYNHAQKTLGIGILLLPWQ